MAESSTEDGSKNNEASNAISQEKDNIRRKNLLQRSFSILGHLFHRTNKEDFEMKLQSLSKEEAAVHTRMKKRSQMWRKLARGLIVYSVIIELLTLGIAIISTRAPEVSWQMRALRVLPVFIFPPVATLVYSMLARYYRMRERKDQKTLERLRNERQAKIDELKERTNYYLTQQLIQKYDSDMTAKEAAARVLAAKLGTEAGFKLSPEQSQSDEMAADTRKVDQDGSSVGIRRRIPPANGSSLRSGESSPSSQQLEEKKSASQYRANGHLQPRMDSEPKPSSGGWVARLAAILVGEDPTQSYALICGNCSMHNGLARKEEYHLITYYCPHCHFLNGQPKLPEITESTSLANVMKEEPMKSNASSSTSGSHTAPQDEVKGPKSE